MQELRMPTRRVHGWIRIGRVRVPLHWWALDRADAARIRARGSAPADGCLDIQVIESDHVDMVRILPDDYLPGDPECCNDAMIWDEIEKKWLCIECENYFDPWAARQAVMKQESEK